MVISNRCRQSPDKIQHLTHDKPLRWLLCCGQTEGRQRGKQRDQLEACHTPSWRKARGWAGRERRKGAKRDDSKVFGLSNWKDKAAVNSDGEDCGSRRFGGTEQKFDFAQIYYKPIIYLFGYRADVVE